MDLCLYYLKVFLSFGEVIGLDYRLDIFEMTLNGAWLRNRFWYKVSNSIKSRHIIGLISIFIANLRYD